MAITITKEAAKAIVITMENEGMDANQFALEFGTNSEGITIAFLKMSQNKRKNFINQHQLYVCDDGSLNNMVIDFGKHENKKGLFFRERGSNGN